VLGDVEFAVIDRAIVPDAQDVVSMAREHRHVVVWSGNSEGVSFERDPRVWMPDVRERFVAMCERIDSELAGTPNRVIVRTHCRHVLSDLPACRWFCEQIRTKSLGLCIDIASMFERSMMDRAEDHLRRLLGEVTCADLVLVREPLPGGTSDEDRVPEAGAIGSSGIRMDVLRELLETLAERGTRLVVDGDLAEPSDQSAILGGEVPNAP
jgi:hypothetical protein